MSWIFQGNPNKFDIDDYLARYPTFIYWSTPTHRANIQLGDYAFIWRAGSKAGLIAIGEVAELPVPRKKVKSPEALSDDLWHQEPPDPDEFVVGIKLDEVRLTEEEGMIPRKTLSQCPIVGTNAIITAPHSTIFRLNPDQEEKLLAYWIGIPSDRSSETGTEFFEGASTLRFHKCRERSSVLRKRKIDIFLANHDKLFCEVCGFKPGEKYPKELYPSVIEVHHSKPLSEAQSTRPTKLADLLVVCANCHRVIHSSSEVEKNTKSLQEQFKNKYNLAVSEDGEKARRP